jgi:glutathione S-transferase
MSVAVAFAETSTKLWLTKSCPYAHRVRILCIERSIDVELQYVDLANKPKELCDIYSQITSNSTAAAKVPIFEDSDGFKLIDSAIIVQYLNEKYPNLGSNIVPQLASERAVCRLFVNCYEKTMSPLIVAVLKASDDSLEMEKLRQTLPATLQTVNRFLECNAQKSGPFVLGNCFSYAEVMTAPFIQRLVKIAASFCSIDLMEECEKAGCVDLMKWIEAVVARESVESTKLDDEQLFKNCNRMKDMIRQNIPIDQIIFFILLQINE